MADFEVMGGKFHIRANDGHFSENYEIEALSQADAMAEARRRWGSRRGARNAPTYDAALAAGHAEEMKVAADAEHKEPHHDPEDVHDHGVSGAEPGEGEHRLDPDGQVLPHRTVPRTTPYMPGTPTNEAASEARAAAARQAGANLTQQSASDAQAAQVNTQARDGVIEC
jgi:hypothetical protein